MYRNLTLIVLIFLYVDAHSQTVPAVIYGQDDREFSGTYSPLAKMYDSLAKSTSAMISSSRLELDNGDYKILGENFQKRYGLCSDEKFVDSMAASFCSGFLVGPDLLVTAGHCMTSQSHCDDFKWVFNYRDNAGNDVYVDEDDVYSCETIINQKLNNTSFNDFALIKLDRPVKGRRPLKFRKKGKIKDNQSLVIIGHPSGLPSIISDNASVRDNDNDFFFSSNVDSFIGSSGSAVFNADTGIVEGILVRGEQDYIRDEEAGCNRVFKCENDNCKGEEITRITVIPQLAPGMTPAETMYDFGDLVGWPF